MKFKAKLRRIGNSRGVIIPLEVITGYKLGDEIELKVITDKEQGVITSPKSVEVITETPPQVITPIKKRFNTAWCSKHTTYKGSCGCL